MAKRPAQRLDPTLREQYWFLEAVQKFIPEAIEDLDGVTHAMVGILPATVRMRPRRLSLGYTEVTLSGASPLGAAGSAVRGHEFHYSSLDAVRPRSRASTGFAAAGARSATKAI